MTQLLNAVLVPSHLLASDPSLVLGLAVTVDDEVMDMRKRCVAARLDGAITVGVNTRKAWDLRP